MGDTTNIAWADRTFNPWIGCDKVSPACDHCYAEAWALRFKNMLWGAERVRTATSNWKKPHRWNRIAQSQGLRTKVFCASLADIFDNQVPRQWRDELFEVIRRTPLLDWLLLTKRIGNASAMLPGEWGEGFDNVWLGSTVVTQIELCRDVPKLAAVPAKVRFLSCEPLLEPLDLSQVDLRGIHWVICGGESGRYARPLDIEWVKGIRRQCAERGIAFFMKQGSEANWPDFSVFETFPEEVRVRETPGRAVLSDCA